jgi:carboxymethylenebutenolidase
MVGETIKYKTRSDEEFDGYLTKPGIDDPLPGIVIIPAIFGTDEDMIQLSDAWASDGFIVSVPDIFWRVLPGPTADHAVGRDRMGKFDLEQGMDDIEDVIADLKNRPECNGKVGMLGFCFGGRYVHLSAARLGIDAGAAFHGTAIGKNLEETSKITCPMSLHFGGVDLVVPMEEVNEIKAAYAGKSNVDIVVYEGAGHSFSMPSNQGYDADVAKASRDAALTLFRSM